MNPGYNSTTNHLYTIYQYDPLTSEIEGIQRNMLFCSQPTLIINKLNDIVHANERRLSLLSSICPLSAEKLAKNSTVRSLLNKLLTSINEKISECTLHEVESTKKTVKKLLEDVPREFRDKILYNLKKHWSDTYSSLFKNTLVIRPSLNPSWVYVRETHFDSINEIILFDQLIKAIKNHNFKALIKINNFNFGQLSYYKDSVINEALSAFATTINSTNYRAKLDEYILLCNTTSFDQNTITTLQGQSIQSFKCIFEKLNKQTLSNICSNLKQTDTVSMSIKEMICALIAEKIDHELSRDGSHQHIDDIFRFMHSNTHLPSLVFTSLRRHIINDTSLGLKSLARAHTNRLLENSFNHSVIANVAQYFSDPLNKEISQSNSLQELQINLQSLKNENDYATLTVSLPHGTFNINLFDGFVSEAHIPVHDCPVADQIMNHIWLATSQIVTLKVKTLVHKFCKKVRSTNIDEYHAILCALDYPFLMPCIKTHVGTEKIGGYQFSDHFIIPESPKQMLYGISYLQALKSNNLSRLLECCKNKKLIVNRPESSKETIKEDCIPQTILDAIRIHIKTDIYQKTKKDSLECLIAIARHAQNLNATNEELYNHLKPLLQEKVAYLKKSATPNYSIMLSNLKICHQIFMSSIKV